MIKKMEEIKECPEGHICTSSCGNDYDCPCGEHEHSGDDQDEPVVAETEYNAMKAEEDERLESEKKYPNDNN